MKHFACGDLVPGCDATFRGTESQILGQVAEHARVDHGMAVSDELVTGVRANLH